MDVLSIFSVDAFKILTWVLALGVGVVMFVFAHKRKILWPLVEAAGVFVATNLLVWAYVLSNLTDPRWSDKIATKLDAPQLPDSPFFGDVTKPLNDFFGTTTGTVNDFLAYQNALEHALPVANNFLFMAGWGSLVFFPLLAFAIFRTAVAFLTLNRRVAALEQYVEAQKKKDDTAIGE